MGSLTILRAEINSLALNHQAGQWQVVQAVADIAQAKLYDAQHRAEVQFSVSTIMCETPFPSTAPDLAQIDIYVIHEDADRQGVNCQNAIQLLQAEILNPVRYTTLTPTVCKIGPTLVIFDDGINQRRATVLRAFA